MIARFVDMLEQERAAGRAVGAFTCYDLATAFGVLRAAEQESVPVVLLLSYGAFTSREGELLTRAVVAAAAGSPASACVQLDHVGELEAIARALELGIGAVMADGSKLPLEDNARFVSEATRLSRSADAAVEAELGHIEGGEDVTAATEAGALTEPADAVRFLELCEADCLAVSIGNVHGAYAHPPQLDWPRLAAIRERVGVPLSLHGASGLPATDLASAVEGGIAKINVNAELRRRAFEELGRSLATLREGYRVLELQEGLAQVAAEVASTCIRAFQTSASREPY
jgi:tagatose 1,6-diphosphate aldolase GatY/KbaY